MMFEIEIVFSVELSQKLLDAKNEKFVFVCVCACALLVEDTCVISLYIAFIMFQATLMKSTHFIYVLLIIFFSFIVDFGVINVCSSIEFFTFLSSINLHHYAFVVYFYISFFLYYNINYCVKIIIGLKN